MASEREQRRQSGSHLDGVSLGGKENQVESVTCEILGAGGTLLPIPEWRRIPPSVDLSHPARAERLERIS